MKKILVIIIHSIILIVPLFSQIKTINYNEFYQFPVSIGVEYQSLSPFAEYGSNYNIFDVSTNIRVPIPQIPTIQMLVKLGMMNFDYQDPEEPIKWDHHHFYGQIGAAYAHRFDKKFEIGGELLAGYSLAVFPNLIPEMGAVSNSNLIFETGMRISLNPSYNMSIDFHPSLKYLLSVNDFDNYNGFIFGIGITASYRFGTDPDAPEAIIRNLKFSNIQIPDLFASMQSYYVNNSLGSFTITNPEKYDIDELEISFFQGGFMDSPTPVASIPSLKAGDSVNVPLYASFSRSVFSVEGITPLTGEIIISYTSRNRPAEQKISVTYDLYDKTSMIWDDDRKVASFITPADSAIRNYASFLRQSCRDSMNPVYPEPVQFAIQAFRGLEEIGCLYQVDPTLPFTEVQDNKLIVDSISLPRNTLKNITGDCDDLTVLYNSLMETVGIETAFITIPGHIYAAFNTKVPSREFNRIHPDRKMTMSIDGELWIPVEITMIGKSDFTEAWRSGIESWNRYGDSAELRAIYRTRESQEIYRPVGLVETDMGLQYGNGDSVDKMFRNDLDKLIKQIIAHYENEARLSGKKQDFNKLGIVYAQFREYKKAETSFRKVLSIDPEFVNARINMGNLFYLQEEYREATTHYSNAYSDLKTKDRDNGATALKVLINLARGSYMLGQYDKAESYFEMASEIDSEETAKYIYLTETSKTGETRNSILETVKESILFIDEN